MTIDVEDYFQVTAFDQVIPREDWDQFPSRVEQSTCRLLDLFSEHSIRGTFFVLGWVADRFPDLVTEIAARGHEIGSHGYWHRLVYQQTPAEFRADVRRSKQVLEDILGKPVESYRAPTFSIIPQSWWALEILIEEGFTTDSSIFPIRHDRYGMPEFRPDIHQIETPSGSIWEAPLSVARYLRMNFPASGGGYFRLYPLALTRRLFRRVNASGRPVIFYLHPWEIDPDQPRVSGIKRRSALRHRLNLNRTESKLRQLLTLKKFTRLSDVIRGQFAAGTTERVDVPQGASANRSHALKLSRARSSH